MTCNLLNELSLSKMLSLINDGQCSALDIIHACFDRIEAREEVVGAWQHRLTREEYVASYNQQQAFYESSLLKGLPVGIKDIIDTADMPTEMGSVIHQGRTPYDDASCVAALKQAGAIVLGKTVTTEFAYFKPGKTTNPRALGHTPGGSSSGSAAAVADDMVPLALGSQTAASVIRPAAYCGVDGYVATRGTFSLRGIQPLAQSLDSLGIIARSAEDITLARDIILREPGIAKATTVQKPSKILLCPGTLVGATALEMQSAQQQLAEQLANADVEIQQLTADEQLKRLVELHGEVMAYEVCRNLVVESQQLDKVSIPFKELIEKGVQISAKEHEANLTEVNRLLHWLYKQFSDADAILAPSASGAAPEGLTSTGQPHMSRAWQVLGLPVINLALTENPQGLPLGQQLVGRGRSDSELLAIARWIETL